MFDWKRILMGGLAGAMVLPVLFFVVSSVLAPFFPFDSFNVPGSRSLSHPDSWWFLLYPLVLSFSSAFAFDWVHRSFRESRGMMVGLSFSLLLFIVAVIPNLFLVFSTMEYPANFYIHVILRNLFGYLGLGFVFIHIWKK